MGLLQVGQGDGVALGPIIGGAVADRFGYAAAFYVTALLLLMGGLLVLFGVQEPFARRPTASQQKIGLAKTGEKFSRFRECQ
jgi:DHA1 family multidrug resistance protein-like MFS transporter